MLNQKRQRQNFNSNMHRDMIYYNNPPNFKLLSEKYPSFAPYVHFKQKTGSYSIDWNNAKAVKELTMCLLKNDFNITYWDIPEGYLIPTITSRLNYLYWLNDTLKEEVKKIYNELKIAPIVAFIDIGTGANCIYPLLGYKIFKWHFIASDINIESIQSATNIIARNGMTKEVMLIHQLYPKNAFVNLPIKANDKFMFSMCNPPFFDILTDTKHDNPNTDNEYNYFEVYCEGGEIAFIKIMIRESSIFKSNICWFTTLVGKKADMIQIKQLLESLIEVKRIKMTTFYQGKTSRWGIAWSYFNSYEEYMIDTLTIPYIRKQPKLYQYTYEEL